MIFLTTVTLVLHLLRLNADVMPQVSICESLRFMEDCLVAAGAKCGPAEQQSEMILHADKAGHASHGLNRLVMYVKDLKVGACHPNNKPKVLKETVCTAWVDACNVFGATASHYAMDIAIRKAKETGVGWVTVKRSNNYGMAGYWTLKPAKEGLVGMCFTNTSPVLTPTRSKKSALGTNPIAVAAPGKDNELFLLDMATTAVAFGKGAALSHLLAPYVYQLEMQRAAGEPLPSGWALDSEGRETTDPVTAMKAGRLMPLGGKETNSGYKGYGLSAMVDILSGVTSGSNYSYKVRSWMEGSTYPSNIGHCFIAMNPDCFAPGFSDRITDVMRYWRKLPPTDPNLPVLAPGDKERQSLEESEKRGTVFYLEQQIKTAAALAKDLKVKPMEIHRSGHSCVV